MVLKKEFYNTKELAELLEINPRTVQRLSQHGDLKAHRLGSGKRPVLRFRREDIEAYLKKARE